jgi:hypothetical protein
MKLGHKTMEWVPQSKWRQVVAALVAATAFVLLLGYGSLYRGWEWPEPFLGPGWVVTIILFPQDVLAHGNRLLATMAVSDIVLYWVLAWLLIRRLAGTRDAPISLLGSGKDNQQS